MGTVPEYANREDLLSISHPSATARRPLRVDAQRSRERILTAARQIVSSEGEGASLDRIARAAEVGSATLYRHFPDRTSLYEALFQDHVNGLCEQAKALESALPPLQALKAWVRRLVRDSIEHRGLSAAMLLAYPEHAVHSGSCHDQVSNAGRRLVSNATSSGELPDAADFDDLAILITGIVLAVGNSRSANDAVRLTDIMLAGFCLSGKP